MADESDAGKDGHACDREGARQQELLRERAEKLGATAEELEAALAQLTLQAEVVLNRLRGTPLH